MPKNKLLTVLLCLIVLALPSGFYAQEDNSPVNEEANGDRISLDLKNVDIVELLRIVSLKTNKTIVPGKDVAGRITIYLSNVSFNDVLDVILLTQGLALNKKDNVYYVMTEAEYKRIFGQDYIDHRKIETIKLYYAKPSVVFNALGQLKSDVGKIVVDESTGTIILIDIPERLELLKKAISQLDQPLATATFDLNYIKAADAKTQLAAAVTQGTGGVIIDERSGKAIISDLPGKMKSLGTLVREIDEESRQVYIETDIVELTLSDRFERGIDWQKVYASAAMDGLAFAGYFPATLAAAYQKISVGTLATNHYQAILNFLDTYGKTNIISQPKIAVVNNEEANIMVGVREAYITQTQSQATSTTVTSESVEFVDVGVKLKIVPRIGADGFITMKLKPEVSSIKEIITTSLGSRIPIVQTSQSETVVKIKDGMMIMIAGMTKIEDTDSIIGWPILSKIPFLGVFFSHRTKGVTKTEIIIFLTPHIARGDAGLRGKDITDILPMEHLPERLQNKVLRDEAINSGLFEPEKMKADLAAKQAAKEAIEEEARIKEAQKKAKQAISKGATKKPLLTETAKEYYQKGLRAKADFNNSEAIVNFMNAVELDKKYAAAYNSLGIIYEQEGRPDKAEEMYLKAIEADERYYPAYSNLALFNEERKDYFKAMEYWRKRVLYGSPNDEWTQQALLRVKELEDYR
jgi:type II secretory pathway component GspD/PulD (secretin)